MTASTPDATPVRRGEIWWVNLDPARGSEIRKTRPAIVITANALNRVRRTVVVVPLSTGPQPRPPIIVSTPSAGPKFGCRLRSGASGRQAAPDEERRTAFGGGFALHRGQPASCPGTLNGRSGEPTATELPPRRK